MDALWVAKGMGWGVLALLALTLALLIRSRRRTRVKIIHDILIGSTASFALMQAVVTTTHEVAASADSGPAWVATEGAALLITLWMLIPAAFLVGAAPATEGYVILSRGIVQGLHLRLDAMYGPGPARLIAYKIGKDSGRNDTLIALQGAVSGRFLWRTLPATFAITGYGKLRYRAFDPGREVRLVLRDSMEVFDHEHAHESGCDLTRGYLAGLGKAIFPELECEAEETRCAMSSGGEECEFVIRWFEPMKEEATAPVVAGA
jgi:predicted hydrocarbon binding protein